ncbi:MAG TPA: hypothetical protein VFI27_18205 [candidate division Zixibacteria bacterium]|nr:hypothetical protein [candidate division Zixibacteria bacterium]
MAQLLMVECPSDEAVRWINKSLALADLQVATSFDLRSAREQHTECACPHHGTSACDCQMVMLLVYGEDAYPATLVVHGRDSSTYLSLADTPGQRPSSRITATIVATLSLESFSRYECEHDSRQDLYQERSHHPR